MRPRAPRTALRVPRGRRLSAPPRAVPGQPAPPRALPGQLPRAVVARVSTVLGPAPLVRTFTENRLAYVLGRRVEYCDQPTMRAIARAAEANEYKMSAFILGVIKSDAFQMQRAEPMTTETVSR